MKCPECGKEMRVKETLERHVVFDQIDWDEDNEWYETIRNHNCKDCKIKYNENENHWEIPTEFLPSDKQVKCANWIGNLLHTDMPAPTKKSLWKFIKENIERAKVVREQQMDDFYYENYDWLEEPF